MEHAEDQKLSTWSVHQNLSEKNVVRLEFNFGVSAEVDKQIQSSMDLHIFSASI